MKLRKIIATLIFLFLLVSTFVLAIDKNIKSKNFNSVDVFIGTGANGHVYPGATRPFGMVQLSPDGHDQGWNWCSGYHYTDDNLLGFSHKHLSGTGIGDYYDVLTVPSVGKLEFFPGPKEDPDKGYRCRFSHDTEVAEPGYYSVMLADHGIKAELTTTIRAGMHRYTFPKSDAANFMIDLAHAGNWDRVLDLEANINGKNEITGLRHSTGWGKNQYEYFVMQFSKDFDEFGIYHDKKQNVSERKLVGEDLRPWVKFTTKKDEQIIVRVGLSGVSIDGARKNLEAELNHWDFDKVREDAAIEWTKELNKITVTGGTEARQRVFYTSLYRSQLSPDTYNDVDGKYRGIDGEIHQENFTNYTVYSLWDTFRAAHPLYTIIQEDRVADMVTALLRKYQQGGVLPIWPISGSYTWCMIGYHAVPVIADAIMKNIKGFDYDLAYEAIKASGDKLDYAGLEQYVKYGYIPFELEKESVAKTLEYAYDDYCIAVVAKKLGHQEDYERFYQRSQYYKNLFNKDYQFMVPKDADGNWLKNFNPNEVNDHYTEANAWHYSTFVPQDVPGLIELYGGKTEFIKMLDKQFDDDAGLQGRQQNDISGLIGQYAHGNEPSHHVAYLYAYADAPWKTQERVHQIINSQYSDKPDGLAGNEDCGQMSAWFVMSALGFYPVCPGANDYIFGTPMFDEAKINVGHGKVFTVRAINLNDKNFYVKSIRLNGKKLDRIYLLHKEIMQGGELVFEMSDEPVK